MSLANPTTLDPCIVPRQASDPVRSVGGQFTLRKPQAAIGNQFDIHTALGSQPQVMIAIKPVRIAFACCTAAMLSCCQSVAPEVTTNPDPLRATDRPIDLERFMGDWYVIAHIPVFIEKNAYNAVESYSLAPDGTIPTTYTFNQGGFDGPLKTYRPRGFVHDTTTNAE